MATWRAVPTALVVASCPLCPLRVRFPYRYPSWFLLSGSSAHVPQHARAERLPRGAWDRRASSQRGQLVARCGRSDLSDAQAGWQCASWSAVSWWPFDCLCSWSAWFSSAGCHPYALVGQEKTLRESRGTPAWAGRASLPPGHLSNRGSHPWAPWMTPWRKPGTMTVGS